MGIALIASYFHIWVFIQKYVAGMAWKQWSATLQVSVAATAAEERTFNHLHALSSNAEASLRQLRSAHCLTWVTLWSSLF